jgi:hypothetical protein
MLSLRVLTVDGRSLEGMLLQPKVATFQGDDEHVGGVQSVGMARVTPADVVVGTEIANELPTTGEGLVGVKCADTPRSEAMS